MKKNEYQNYMDSLLTFVSAFCEDDCDTCEKRQEVLRFLRDDPECQRRYAKILNDIKKQDKEIGI